MLFSTLWAYQTLMKATTDFTPFQLVYEVEVVFIIECKIHSLKLSMEVFPNNSTEEKILLYLDLLFQYHREATMSNETHKKRTKAQYDKSVHPRIFV